MGYRRRRSKEAAPARWRRGGLERRARAKPRTSGCSPIPLIRHEFRETGPEHERVIVVDGDSMEPLLSSTTPQAVLWHDMSLFGNAD